MDVSQLIGDFEDKKDGFYKEMLTEENQQLNDRRLGQDFDELLQEAKSDPEAAAYLNMRLTQEQAIGYVIVALKLGSINAAEQTALLVEIERQFFTMRPEDAERVYAQSWYEGQ
jgi:hypothetical protein